MGEPSHRSKVAVVTGGSRGLGRAMALGLCQVGARVVITGRDRNALEETRQAASDPEHIHCLTVDVGSDDAPAMIVQTAIDAFGGLDILVNNAGITIDLLRRAQNRPPPTIADITPAEFRHVLNINTVSPFMIARAAIGAMQARGGGRIVNITTSLDTMWRKGLIPYGGSKAANEAHCVALAEELRGSGITVNVLTPGGPADTQMIGPGVDRATLIQADMMVAPLLWLTGTEAADVTATRIIAARWLPGMSNAEAVRASAAPAAWQALGAQAVYPDGHAIQNT